MAALLKQKEKELVTTIFKSRKGSKTKGKSSRPPLPNSPKPGTSRNKQAIKYFTERGGSVGGALGEKRAREEIAQEMRRKRDFSTDAERTKGTKEKRD